VLWYTLEDFHAAEKCTDSEQHDLLLAVCPMGRRPLSLFCLFLFFMETFQLRLHFSIWDRLVWCSNIEWHI